MGGSKILVLGDSGSGKTTATRNLDPKTTFFINVIGKPLPFRGWKSKYSLCTPENKKGNMVSTYSHEDILRTIAHVDQNRPEITTLIIDDAQYIMSYEFMARAKERGFDKFTEIGQHMFNILKAPDSTRENLTTIFLCHSEDVSANGYTRTKMKTIGKMLDEKITIEGLFTVVLLAFPYKKEKTMEYCFVTQSNGTTTAKSPLGLFDEILIPNDLKIVLEHIEEYNKG